MVTSWPTSASDFPRLLAICGRSPEGRISVRSVMKAAMAIASNPPSGSFSPLELLTCVIVGDVMG
jgi:hypothetical protein